MNLSFTKKSKLLGFLMIVNLSIFAQNQTMTFSSGASEPGFTFSYWSYDSDIAAIFMSDPSNYSSKITKTSGAWDFISFDVTTIYWAFGDHWTIKVQSNKGDEYTFFTSTLGTHTLNWTGVTWVTFTKIGGTTGAGGYDNFVYKPLSPPTVTTSASLNVLSTSATLGGNATADGGSTIDDKGVVYSRASVNTNPEVGGTGVTKVSMGSGTGSFSQSVGSLATGTNYYYKAYAHNSAGYSYGTALNFTTLAPEMDVSGNSTSIADGSTSTSVANNTDFGSADVSTGSESHTFTITNTGVVSLNLTGTPIVNVISGDTGDFSITQPSGNSVASGGGTVSFSITFDPTTSGERTATISIDNDDPDENPYTFTIKGIGTAQDINVQGNGNDIANGDAVPSSTDDTDFGSIPVISGTIVKTFTIQNTGTVTLSLTGASPYVVIGGANSGDFSATTIPSNSIAVSGSTTFQITFDPSGVGICSATLSIASDDPDENPYNFSIQGTGTNTTPVATAPSAPTVVEDDVNVALADDIQVADSGDDNQALTFTITGGTLTIGTTGITFGGGGNGSASFTASGTLSDINTALDAATFTPTPNLSGTNVATISFKSNDGIEDSNNASVTFSITAVNDEPGLTATGINPTFTEDGPASDLYSSVSITTAESGQTILQLVLTVANVNNGANEILLIDGSDVALTNGNTLASATNSMAVSVGVSGGTATIAVSKAAGISVSAMQTLVDGITYRNTSNTPNTSNRVVTLTSIQDNGGTANGGDDTATLSVVSTVTVVANNDAPTLTSFAGVVETTTQNTEVEITLSELKAQGNEADVDGTVDAYIVKVLSTGTLKIGANPGAAAAFNATTNKTIDASNNAYWTPAPNAYGALNAFTTTIADNNGLESTGAVQATVQVNDVTNPSVSSITISGSPAATATSVTFIVAFSESVVNVSTDDFSLTAAGTASGTIASVSSPSGSSINVTANSIAGTGTLRLDLKTSTNIADASANTPPAAFTSGSTHTVDRDGPTLSSSAPADNATGFSPLANIVLNFNENVAFGTGNIQVIDLGNGSSTITIDAASPGVQASIASNSLAINPSVNLEENTNYAIQIAATAIGDINGNSYAGIADNTTLNFTTGVLTPRFIGPGTDFLIPAYWESGSVPSQNLDIIIAAGQNLAINLDYTCKSLKFESGSSFQCTGGHILTITGNILDANGRVAISVFSALKVSSSLVIQNVSPPPPGNN
jgi:hypothetical protein